MRGESAFLFHSEFTLRFDVLLGKVVMMRSENVMVKKCYMALKNSKYYFVSDKDPIGFVFLQ